MNEFLKEILPISVVLTFIGTMITLYYTRRNLKTTKYIDIITSERIKWLDTIRNDSTNIITNIHYTLKIYADIIQNNKKEIEVYEEDKGMPNEAQTRYFDAPTSSAFGQKNEIWSQSNFVKQLYLFRLRLNYEENRDIIKTLDYFINFYTKSDYKSLKDINEARNETNKLINKIHSILKDEWEKVKKESRGKFSK